jgi:hypothetical protein
MASGGLTLPQQQQQQQQQQHAAFLTQNFGLPNFLLQPPGGQVRLPAAQPPIVVSSAGGLSPQNAALLQSQLAAQRVLLQQQQQQQQQSFSMADPSALGLMRPGLPPPAFLPTISAGVQLPASGYATTGAVSLGTNSVSNSKRTFDQAFVAGNGASAATAAAAISGKRVNYHGYGALAASPAPTISAGPTTYYTPTPNPT